MSLHRTLRNTKIKIYLQTTFSNSGVKQWATPRQRDSEKRGLYVSDKVGTSNLQDKRKSQMPQNKNVVWQKLKNLLPED